MDDKINLLEKLLAEKNTESAILKKYFFAVSAINQKKKFSTTGRAFMKTIKPSSHLKTETLSPSKQVSADTANNRSYKAPKKD